jgi:hypothetical protein
VELLLRFGVFQVVSVFSLAVRETNKMEKRDMDLCVL